MHTLTTERHGRDMVMVLRNGVFLCWLQRKRRQHATDLQRHEHYTWTTYVAGRQLDAVGMRRLVQKVDEAVQLAA